MTTSHGLVAVALGAPIVSGRGLESWLVMSSHGSSHRAHHGLVMAIVIAAPRRRLCSNRV